MQIATNTLFTVLHFNYIVIVCVIVLTYCSPYGIIFNTWYERRCIEIPYGKIIHTNSKEVHIGDVYMVHFEGSFNEQNGWRPAVIFQNNIGNMYSPNIVALPFTSSLKKTGQPTHVVIPANESGLPCDSMVLCENPSCVSKRRLGNYLTTLSSETMAKIAAASILASSAIAFLSPENLLQLQRRAMLNVAS